MKRLRIFRHTITITSTETWTVSVEHPRPIADEQARSLDAAAPAALESDLNPAEHDAIDPLEPPTQP